VTDLRKVMLEELQRRNSSQLTAPDQLGPEQIRQYQAHLLTNKKLDANTVSQHLSALSSGYDRNCRHPPHTGLHLHSKPIAS
jgi:hypothetical protein